MVIVKLDDAQYGAGPGTIVDHCDTVKQYHEKVRDRAGAIDRRIRLWGGDLPIGTRVVAGQYHGPDNKER